MFDNPFPAPSARILYVHQNVYVRGPDGAIYAEAQFDMRYWSTYLDAFAHVTVAAHVRPATAKDDLARLNKLDHAKLSFLFAPKLTNLKTYATDRRIAAKELIPVLADADLLVLRTYSELGDLAYRLKPKTLPYVMEMGGCPFDNTWHHGHVLAKFAAPIRMLKTKARAKHALGVLYVTRDFLPRRYPTKGLMAVASNVRLNEPDDTALQARLAKPIGETVHIGLIGAVNHKLKGVPVAITALADAQKRSGKQIVLHLLGPGDATQLVQMGANLGLRVEADGLLPGGQAVYNWLDMLDLYVQPSFHEGLPRATLEAMSRALPVFSSTAGGLPEIVTGANLHKPGDNVTLANQLVAFLASGEEIRRKQATLSFERARAYAPSVLEPIRRQFWRRIVEDIER
jgi:glycosyltransferase involved in cell wall biosynthesis